MAQALTGEKECCCRDTEIASSAKCQLLIYGWRGGVLGDPVEGLGRGTKGLGSVAFCQNRVFQYFND